MLSIEFQLSLPDALLKCPSWYLAARRGKQSGAANEGAIIRFIGQVALLSWTFQGVAANRPIDHKCRHHLGRGGKQSLNILKFDFVFLILLLFIFVMLLLFLLLLSPQILICPMNALHRPSLASDGHLSSSRLRSLSHSL